jgi:hypothetical protein
MPDHQFTAAGTALKKAGAEGIDSGKILVANRSVSRAFPPCVFKELKLG